MSRTVEDETTVNGSYSVTVPASVREEAGIEAGDRLRWRVDEEGKLTVEVVQPQSGPFAALEPVALDERTNAAEDHDDVPGEY